MKRLAWPIDIHPNFVAPGQIDAPCRSIREATADATLLTSDVAEAPEVVAHLERLGAGLGRLLSLVLGDHDSDLGSIAALAEPCARSSSRPRTSSRARSSRTSGAIATCSPSA